ncbi:MAG: YbjN domain-containing protein [Clostridia bacterium]|nr:YbjN domain-containing protein [Clostridia bacterium]
MLNTCAQNLANLLQLKGLDFDTKIDNDGDSVVIFGYGGKRILGIFSGEDGTYFSLGIFYESIPEDKIPDVIFACNEINATYKWVKYYVDHDGDLMIKSDAILSTDDGGEEAFELLLRVIKISEDAKPIIMKTIYA